MQEDQTDLNLLQHVYWSTKIQASLRQILVALRDKKKFIAVIGDRGFGKTELCNLLSEGLADGGYDVQTLEVSKNFSPLELLTLLSSNLDASLENQTKLNLLQLLRNHYQNNVKNTDALIIVDNCSRLESEDFFEDLKYIAESSDNLQIVMFGEAEFLSGFNSVFSLLSHDIEVIKLEEFSDAESREFIGWLSENVYVSQKRMTDKVKKFIVDTSQSNPGKIKLLTKIAFEVKNEKGKWQIDEIKKRWDFLDKF